MASEEWQMFRDMKRERQEKRSVRRDEWQKLWEDGKLSDWVRHSEIHYSYHHLDQRLDYWPGPSKWRHEGMTRTGDVLVYIKRRGRNRTNA